MSSRWVVVGLAHPRSPWFSDVGRWASSATIAVDFLKCVSVPEARARIASGRAISALMMDASLGGERDLIDEVRSAGAAVIIVEDGRGARDWDDLGVSAILPAQFGPDDLADLLETNAPTINDVGAARFQADDDDPADVSGRLVAVTGAGGTGTSTIAAALAQELGGGSNDVALVDLALDADQAVLHDARDLVPGVQELCDAHRHGVPDSEAIRSLTFDAPARGYRLLLGLRRPHDWTAIRPRSFDAALAGLRNSFDIVVADIESDVSGEQLTGSMDIEERNTMARATALGAEAIVVVGRPDLVGVHRQLAIVRSLVDLGVESDRIILVSNTASRRLGQRAAVARALDELAGPGLDVVGPIHVPRRRGIEQAAVDSAALPSLAGSVGKVVEQIFSERPRHAGASLAEPTLVAAGSLGSWAEDESEDGAW